MFIPFHTDISWGEKEGVVSISFPYRRNWGRRRGEWRRRDSEEKLCLGKAVALIQHGPFKRGTRRSTVLQVLSRPSRVRACACVCVYVCVRTRALARE